MDLLSAVNKSSTLISRQQHENVQWPLNMFFSSTYGPTCKNALLWMPVTIIALCSFFSVHSDPNVVRGHNVINVIIPESRIHFFQQLGYVLATLLLFVVLLIIVVFITRKRRQRGECWKTPSLECWGRSRGRRGDSASNYCAAQCLLKASQQRGLNSCYALLLSVVPGRCWLDWM